ncbi:MAG: peptidylprolyl isomerase [Gammaproteobacteria bacterium]|nr:peptidylprolyl isomerase [Gammaproteobacteria bacterium]
MTHKAKARHILLETEQQAIELKQQILSFEDFDRLARAFSQCPSGRVGGDLGIIPQGKMVAAFDAAVFSGELNCVLGPVVTPYGHHLIWVTARKS